MSPRSATPPPEIAVAVPMIEEPVAAPTIPSGFKLKELPMLTKRKPKVEKTVEAVEVPAPIIAVSDSEPLKAPSIAIHSPEPVASTVVDDMNAIPTVTLSDSEPTPMEDVDSEAQREELRKRMEEEEAAKEEERKRKMDEAAAKLAAVRAKEEEKRQAALEEKRKAEELKAAESKARQAAFLEKMKRRPSKAVPMDGVTPSSSSPSLSDSAGFPPSPPLTDSQERQLPAESEPKQEPSLAPAVEAEVAEKAAEPRRRRGAREQRKRDSKTAR